MYLEKHTLREVGECVGLNRERVRQILRANKIPARKNPPTPSVFKCTKRWGRLTAPERFWQGVDITSDSNECWNWTRGKYPTGYGRTYFRGEYWYAHRLALYLSNKKRPSLLVLHSCDNPSCCNPTHLREGTPQDNVDDREQRYYLKRSRGGGKRLFDNHDVKEIDKLIAQGYTQFNVAEKLQVSSAVILRVANRSGAYASFPVSKFKTK